MNKPEALIIVFAMALSLAGGGSNKEDEVLSL